MTILTVLYRRPFEYGGKKMGKRLTCALFVGLWLLYLLMSILSTYGVIG